MFKGDFWERLELYEFPLDIQELSITICSKLDSSELEIIPDQEKLSTIHPRAFKTFESQQVYRVTVLCFHILFCNKPSSNNYAIGFIIAAQCGKNSKLRVLWAECPL